MPDSNTAGEVMPNFQEYFIYKYLELDKIGITDAKDKVKYCVDGLDAMIMLLGQEMDSAGYH